MEKFKLARIQDYNGDLSRRWYIQYSYRNPDTHKFQPFRIWVSSQCKTSVARYVEAKTLRDKINSKLRAGYNPFKAADQNKTLIAALQEIVALKAAACGKRAETSYRSISNKLISWLQHNSYAAILPPEFNRHMALEYFDSLLLSGKYSNRTYNNNLTSLRTLFNELFERDYVDMNVLQKIKKLPEGEAPLSTYTPAEKFLIKKTLESNFPQLLLAAYLIHYCFLRPAELVRLKIENVLLQKNAVFVSSAQSKNKKNKPVTMPHYVSELFERLGYNKLPGGMYIFSNNHKLTPGIKKIAPTRIAEMWKVHVQDALEIKKGIYLMKHTGNGEIIDQGADARDIQMQNRHASLEYTQKYMERHRNTPSERLKEKFLAF